MDTTRLGIWICLDTDHDLFCVLYGLSMESAKQDYTAFPVHSSMDIERILESTFLYISPNECRAGRYRLTEHPRGIFVIDQSQAAWL